ncbi:hypothetical protein ILFOPFJJ_06774 [Ensifer psoraleae]|nr:hypothetical protein [Sinorhizobium psoraleae]
MRKPVVIYVSYDDYHHLVRYHEDSLCMYEGARL